MPMARQDVVIELNASSFLVDRVVPYQNVFVCGLFVGFCRFKGYLIKSFLVSRAIISGRSTRLSLTMPTATSPNSLGIGEDLREPGISLASITFKTVQFCSLVSGS